MRDKTIKKCMEIIARIVTTQNIGGISYIEESLRIERENNIWRELKRVESVERGEKE